MSISTKFRKLKRYLSEPCKKVLKLARRASNESKLKSYPRDLKSSFHRKESRFVCDDQRLQRVYGMQICNDYSNSTTTVNKKKTSNDEEPLDACDHDEDLCAILTTEDDHIPRDDSQSMEKFHTVPTQTDANEDLKEDFTTSYVCNKEIKPLVLILEEVDMHDKNVQIETYITSDVYTTKCEARNPGKETTSSDRSQDKSAQLAELNIDTSTSLHKASFHTCRSNNTEQQVREMLQYEYEEWMWSVLHCSDAERMVRLRVAAAAFKDVEQLAIQAGARQCSLLTLPSIGEEKRTKFGVDASEGQQLEEMMQYEYEEWMWSVLSCGAAERVARLCKAAAAVEEVERIMRLNTK